MKMSCTFLISIFLFGCGDISEQSKDPVSSVSSIHKPDTNHTICSPNHMTEGSCNMELLTSIPPDTSTYTSRVEIFQLYRDSITHHANVYLQNGTPVEKIGKWYYSVPFESYEISNYTIQEGKEEGNYTSFDSLMCEVGGNSAYDSIVYRKDELGRIVEMNHYMAWFESYDEETGETYYDYTPDWFLGYVTTIQYEADTIIRVNSYYVDEELNRELEHEVVTHYDEKGRITFQVWNQYAKTYNAYFYYE